MKEATGLSNTMLKIEELSFAFPGERPIFDKITLDVHEGEFVSLIGSSGSGKSTLFKLITGLLQPDGGSIHISRSDEAGYMPQKDLLLPWRTVLDNVLLPIEIKGNVTQEKKAEIHQWLTRFGLDKLEKAYPHELSGGMRQRVAFLRTLMTESELLLLDEPFGALDALTKRNMHRWLLDLWGELQKTVLFITHDLEEALLLSDRIYLLPDSPSQSVKEMKVELSRPRQPGLIYDPLFLEMRKEIERLMNHEKKY